MRVDHVALWRYFPTVVSVGIRDLKNRLSEYLRMVRAGEEILVTDRGEAVAEIRQPTNAPDKAAFPELVRRARAGKVRLGAPDRSGLYPPLPPSAPPGAARRLLREERGDR